MKKFITKMICIAFTAMLCTWNLNAQNCSIVLISNPAAGGIVTGGGAYEQRELVTVTATPNLFFEFGYWTDEDGVVVSENAEYTFTVEGNRTLVANFAPGTCEITVSANPPECGAVSDGGTYNYGDPVVVKAEAKPDFLFINWTEDGNIVSTEADYSFSAYGPRNLVANFVPSTCKIELSKNIEEVGTLEGAGTYSYGQIVVVSANNYLPEYMFGNWTEDGKVVAWHSFYTFTATQDRHLVANFIPAFYQIHAYARPYEGGSVAGAGVYNYGTSVTLSAKENPGYQFLNWEKYVLGIGTVVSTDPDYTFEVTTECSYVANFKEEIDVVILTNMPGGEVLGGGTYKHGDEVTVEAVPNPGYKFVNWTEGRGTASTDNPYSFTVTENMVLVANFEEDGMLSIDPIDAGAAVIYPNPTNSDMTVVLNNPSDKIAEMELYDITGRKVHQQIVNKSYETLKMNGLAQGIYVLKIRLDNGDMIERKVVKN